MAMTTAGGKGEEEGEEVVEEEVYDDYDDELKDEELVDFEVSDYEGEYDDGSPAGLEEENEKAAVDPRQRRSSWNFEAGEQDRSSENQDGPGDSVKTAVSEHGKTVEGQNLQERNGTEAFHGGNDEHQRVGGSNGTRQVSICSEDRNCGDKGGVISSKPELEDGELDETAMLYSYENGTEGESGSGIHVPEWKKRKAIAMGERHVSCEGKRNCKKEGADTGVEGPQHCTSDTSERIMENLTRISGGRGANMRVLGLDQGNFAPGIMGPGRPFRLPQGFGPFGGIGRPNVHLQEVLAQENLLRAHAIHLAQETVASVMHHPLNPAIGSGLMNPYLGFDNLRPRVHIPKYFPPLPPPPDIVLGRMEDVMRGLRPIHKAGRSSPISKLEGETELSGIGRQFSLPHDSMLDFHRRKDQMHSRSALNSMWERDGGLLNNPIHGGVGSPGISLGPNSRHFSTDEVVHHPPLSSSMPDGSIVHNEIYDVRSKIEKERKHKKGSWKFNRDTMLANVSVAGKDINRKISELNPVASTEKPRSPSTTARVGLPLQAKDARDEVMNTSSNSVSGNNVVKLHQPIRKSRILTVSGLPEDISMSTVVETFEKLGKIIDFKKNKRGATITISYASEAEAVTAKRNLHRSYLAGKQITVDYEHQ